MGKSADQYFECLPWEIRETGFDPEYSQVAESVFSLGNEQLGMRGYFDEGYSGPSLRDCYLNGVYETRELPRTGFKGMLSRAAFMTNTVDPLYLKITCNGVQLDLAVCRFTDFVRTLDLRTGVLERCFTWQVDGHTVLSMTFERFVSMISPHLCGQSLQIRVIRGAASLSVEAGLDFSRIHTMSNANHWDCRASQFRAIAEPDSGICRIAAKTRKSQLEAWAASRVRTDLLAMGGFADEAEQTAALCFRKQLTAGETGGLTRLTAVTSNRYDRDGFPERCRDLERQLNGLDYDTEKAASASWWKRTWETSDILIEGDPANQQGIRFCIFQMHQTLQTDRGAVIGAKGLTGEVYNGNTFWDTEVYCLPFYLFNNPEAARGILQFRKDTLPQARERARQLDLKGAFYPIATINGEEGNDLWQYANLQLQASTAVAYALWLYRRVTGDTTYLYRQGAEILVEICRMLASRGGTDPRTGAFGFYGVMGPDEFQMMVNHNAYTNFMAKKTLAFTLELLDDMKRKEPDLLASLWKQTGLNGEELVRWADIRDRMYIPFDSATGLFEQQEGFFGLPHVDIRAIPREEFPLYNHWSYDRLYRNDVIKQPDVLMFLLLYNGEFSREQLRVNYEYYEPRCLHESSLSPSVHSILAAQLGKLEEACSFFRFATRMDLDNYNRNTRQGLHTTSNAGAWMNVVFGFGGMRCDGDCLSFAPCLPAGWSRYRFRVCYKGTTVTVEVTPSGAVFSTDGPAVQVRVYGTIREVSGQCLTLPLQDFYGEECL